LNVELIALMIDDGSCAVHCGDNVLGEGFMAEKGKGKRKEGCGGGKEGEYIEFHYF